MSSLKGRLRVAVGLSITLCWALALGILIVHLQQSQSSTWDGKLQAIATKLLQAIPRGSKMSQGQGQIRPGLQLPENLNAADDGENHDEEALALQIWLEGTLVARSPGAPAQALKPDFIEGFASTRVDGQRWRVYSVTDSTGRITVQVANLHSVIDAALRRKVLAAMGIATAMLLLMGALILYAIRRSLKPVVSMARAVRGRQKFDLAPLPVAPLPAELQPLVDAFNHVLAQLSESVENERRFIGDAAHELRTPLSALQAQAQVALRAATIAEKDQALVKLLAVVDRSARLSEQLLDLARLSAGTHAPRRERADLSELAVHVVREFDVQAQQEGRSIVLAVQTCEIECDVDEIGILLRNLIDNALRYTPRGGTVRIACSQASDGRQPVVLEVADDGPGVPETQREAIFVRFHRVPGNGGRGSGIGLSLVAGIARLHGATISTGTGLDGRGFAIYIEFPPASPAASSGEPR
ncbi:MAG: ATP-binding protein [Solimonas sp.]